MNISKQMLHNAFYGLESNNNASGRTNISNVDIYSTATSPWGMEATKSVVAKITAMKPKYNDGETGDKSQRNTGNSNILSTTIKAAVEQYTASPETWTNLPGEVKSLLAVPADAYFTYKRNYDAIGAEEAKNNVLTGREKFKLGVLAKGAKQSLDSALFSTFANIYTASLHGGSGQIPTMKSQGGALESYHNYGKSLTPNGNYTIGDLGNIGFESTQYTSFADQILIPKVSSIVNWFNSAATIYDKIQPKTTVYNELVQLPITTKFTLLSELDEAGKVVKQWRREELYRYMDLSKTAPNIAEMRVKTLVLDETEFNDYRDLHNHPFVNNGNAPILDTQETIGPQIRAYALTLDENDPVSGVAPHIMPGDITSNRAGVMQNAAIWSEEDRKGATARVWYDDTKFYNIFFDFDIQKMSVLFSYTKSDTSLPDVLTVNLEFNSRDVMKTMRSRVSTRIVEERAVLSTTQIDRVALPILTEEYDILGERGSDAHLSKLINTVAEYQQHKKEYNWMKNVFEMKDMLKAQHGQIGADGEPLDKYNLYAESTSTLATATQLDKLQDLGYVLGNNFAVMREDLRVKANSGSYPQISMFCGSKTLLALNQQYESIVGKVEESSDNKFLGIQQHASVNALTFGVNSNNPVQAIIVATDKQDPVFAITGYDETGTNRIADKDVEYVFNAVVQYEDKNIHTFEFLEQPTKVITGNEIRSIEHALLPSVIIYDGYKACPIRPAIAEFKIKGLNFRATSRP